MADPCNGPTGETIAARIGRSAKTPGQIPPGGWKDILWRVYVKFNEERVLLVAAGCTYYLILALFPGLTALVAAFGFFADPTVFANQLSALEGFVPDNGLDIIRGELQRLTSQEASQFSLTLIISLSIAMWSANAGSKAVFQAMNVAYGEKEKRSFVWLTALTFAFTLGAMIIATLFVSVVVVIPILTSLIPFESGVELLGRILSFCILFIFLSLGLSILYRWGPSRKRAKWRWVTAGSAFALVVMLILSVTYTWYVGNFASYSATYGSFGAIIGFMTWIWLTITVVILGAELNAEIEHQTQVDSTVGGGKPMGERGAVVADTLGKSLSEGATAEDVVKDQPEGAPPKAEVEHEEPEDGPEKKKS